MSITLSNWTGFVIISSSLRVKQPIFLGSILSTFKQAFFFKNYSSDFVILSVSDKVESKNLKYFIYSFFAWTPFRKFDKMHSNVFYFEGKLSLSSALIIFLKIASKLWIVNTLKFYAIDDFKRVIIFET